MAINDNKHTFYTASIVRYIEKGKLPSNPSEVSLDKRRVNSYYLIEGILHQKGLSIPLLKCLEIEEVVHTLIEVHK